MPANTAWKTTERAIAKRLGGRRAGPTGRTGSDVIDAPIPFAIEVKHRQALPGWLLDAMSQSRGAARVDQTAIVVLHQLGARHDNDLVVMRLRDFEDWAGRLPAALVEEGT